VALSVNQRFYMPLYLAIDRQLGQPKGRYGEEDLIDALEVDICASIVEANKDYYPSSKARLQIEQIKRSRLYSCRGLSADDDIDFDFFDRNLVPRISQSLFIINLNERLMQTLSLDGYPDEYRLTSKVLANCSVKTIYYIYANRNNHQEMEKLADLACSILRSETVHSLARY
jgi:hypothetical protein